MTADVARARVAIDRVDVELRKLWALAGPDKKGITRVETMNVVALCETPDHASIAEPALAAASAIHGARTLLVTWHEGAPPLITADVALRPSLRPGLPGGEGIWVDAIGAARDWIPETLGRLIEADLPTYVWWVGDLPDHDDLLQRVAAVAQLVIVNSNDMDMRDLPALDRLAERPFGQSSMADFCWHRLRMWQELTARFFDEPRLAPDLAKIERIAIRYQPRTVRPEPVSNQAALFAGWLAGRLGWTLDAWTSRDPAGPTVRLARAGGGTVELRFAPTVRDGVLPGGIVAVDLFTADSEFHVSRDESDPSMISWSGERPGVPLPAQTLRLGVPDEARMLGRVLDRPIKDPLFETSLRHAARLVAEIAPAAPRVSIVVVPGAEAFALEGAALFARFATEAIEARGRFSVALTGGSTPGPIHRALVSAAIDWSKVDVFFGDERAVAPDAKESNYGSARELLLRHVPAAKVHRIEGERADLAAVAREYESDLLATCEGALDLLMVGVGKDAHILSLFPGSPAIEHHDALVVAAIDPPMNPALSRVTMTPAVITRARHVLAIAAGAEKQHAVTMAIEGPLDRAKYPAQLLRTASDVTWLIDAAAAQGLTI